MTDAITPTDRPEPVTEMRRTHEAQPTPPRQACPSCGELFQPRRRWQRFCSTRCRRNHHRARTKHATLASMVATAKALGYDCDTFTDRLRALWKV